MSDVTRGEFDGLGRRVNEAEKAAIRCGTDKDGKIAALRADTERQEQSISMVFNKVNAVETQVAALPGKIDKAVGNMGTKIVTAVSIIVGIVLIIVQGLTVYANSIINGGPK